MLKRFNLTNYRIVIQEDIWENLDEFVSNLNKSSKYFYASRVGKRVTIRIKISKSLFSFNPYVKFASFLSASSMEMTEKNEMNFKVSAKYFSWYLRFVVIVFGFCIFLNNGLNDEISHQVGLLLFLLVFYLAGHLYIWFMMKSFLKLWNDNRVLGNVKYVNPYGRN